MSFLHIFLVAEDNLEEQNTTYSKAWGDALKSNPMSLVIFIINIPGLLFIGALFVYQTYL